MTNEQKQQLKPSASTVKPETARHQEKGTTPETLKSKQRNTKTDKTVGGRISLLRQAAGMTQEQLAGKLFMSSFRVCRLENDTQKPTCDELVLMCELFGTTADYIVRGIKNTPANLDLTPDERKLVIGLLEKLKTC